MAADADGEEPEPDAGLLAIAEDGDDMAMFRVAFWFDDRDKPGEALAWWERSAQLGNEFAMVQLGWRLARDSDRQAGERWLMRAYELGAGGAAYCLGRLAEDESDSEAAEQWYLRGVELDNEQAMHALGLRAERAGSTDEAISWYRRAGDAGYDAAYVRVGKLLEARGDDEGASAAYLAAAEAGNTAGAYNLASHFLDAGELDAALTWYDRLAARGEADGDAGAGLVLERRGDLAAAEARYRISAEAASTLGMTYLGSLFEARGDIDEAIEWYQRAFEAGRQSGAPRAGHAYLQQGELELAERWYRKVADRGPAWAQVGLGAALERQGKFDEALAWYTRAARTGDASAQRALGALAQEREAWDEAERAFRNLADQGDHDAMTSLAWLVDSRGDDDGAAELQAAAVRAGLPVDASAARWYRRRRAAWATAHYGPVAVLAATASLAPDLSAALAVALVMVGPLAVWAAAARLAARARNRCTSAHVRFDAWPHAAHTVRPYTLLLPTVVAITALGPAWGVGVLLLLSVASTLAPLMSHILEPAVLPPELEVLAAGPPRATVYMVDDMVATVRSSAMASPLGRIFVTARTLKLGGPRLDRTMAHEFAHVRRGFRPAVFADVVAMVVSALVGATASTAAGGLAAGGVKSGFSFAHALTTCACFVVAAYVLVEPVALASYRREERETERLALRLLPATPDRVAQLAYAGTIREPALYHLLSSRHPNRDVFLELHQAYLVELRDAARDHPTGSATREASG